MPVERHVEVRALQYLLVLGGGASVEGDDVGRRRLGLGVVAETELHDLRGAVVYRRGGGGDDVVEAVGVAGVQAAPGRQGPGLPEVAGRGRAPLPPAFLF